MIKNKKPSAQKAQRAKRSPKLKTILLAPYRHSRTRLALFILIFAVIGGAVIYYSMAADFNSNDEKIQYDSINFTRASLGEQTLAASTCLNSIARNWSKYMAAHGFMHNPNELSQVLSDCGSGAKNWAWLAENIAERSPCPNPATDGCSAAIYSQFVHSPDHYANIVSFHPNYVGVGAYRDNQGNIWVTQDFLQCANCGIATYAPSAWQLTGSATVASATSTRATNINIHAGQTIVLYNDVSNLGPNTAIYPVHVDNLHYSYSGKLVSSTQIDIVSKVSTTKGGVYAWSVNSSIPTNAPIGDKYCHAIWYNYAFGPGTGAAISPQSCAQVIR